MATLAPLSPFQEVSLPQGTVRYCDQGTGPTLVFIHGLLANRLLWSRVIPRLVSHFRCVAPDLPLGGHAAPMHPDADMSPLGVARLVANFLAWTLHARFVQRTFVAALAHHPLDLAELDATFSPLLHLPGVRRDMTRFLQAVSRRYTLEAAHTFSSFRHPVLLVWGKDDPFFSSRLATRLQQAFPDATLEFLSHSRAFVQLDQPETFAQQITEFVHAAANA